LSSERSERVETKVLGLGLRVGFRRWLSSERSERVETKVLGLGLLVG